MGMRAQPGGRVESHGEDRECLVAGFNEAVVFAHVFVHHEAPVGTEESEGARVAVRHLDADVRRVAFVHARGGLGTNPQLDQMAVQVEQHRPADPTAAKGLRHAHTANPPAAAPRRDGRGTNQLCAAGPVVIDHG